MSAKELQALTQKLADAFDQRDLQPILDMLSEDVEVFDHVPYRFTGVTKDGKTLSIHGRTTLVFIKPSGQWKIVSAHFSAIPKAL